MAGFDASSEVGDSAFYASHGIVLLQSKNAICLTSISRPSEIYYTPNCTDSTGVKAIMHIVTNRSRTDETTLWLSTIITPIIRDGIDIKITISIGGFGGLGVSMLASGTHRSRVRSRPKPSDLSGWKNPSFGGEVKESLPCPSFGACQRTQLSS
jgi:hypothetical protein